MPVAASGQTEPAVSAHVGHLAPKRSSQGYSTSNPGTMPPGASNCYTMQSSTSECLASNLGQFTGASISTDNSPMESTSQFFSAASSEMLDLGARLDSSESHRTSPAYGLRESTRRRSIQELMSPGRAHSTQYYTMEATSTRKSESPSRKKRKLAHPGSVVDLTGQSPPPPATSQPWIEPSEADTLWQPARRLRCTSQRNCHTSAPRSPTGSRRRSRPERPTTRHTQSPDRAAFQPPPPAPPAPAQPRSLPAPPPPQMAHPPMMYEMSSAANPMSVPTFAIPVCTAPHHYPLCTGIPMPLCNTNTTWSLPGCGLPVPVCGVQHLPGCNFAHIPVTHAMPHNIVQSHRASHPLNHHPSQQPSAHQPSSSSSSQAQSHQPHHSHHHQAHHPHPQHHQPVVSQPRGHPSSHPHPHPHSTVAPHFLSTQTPLQTREDGHLLTEHRIPFTHIPHQGGAHRSAVAPSPAVLLQEPSVHPVPHGIYSPLSRLRRNSTSRSRWRSIPPPPPPYPGFLLHFLAMLGNPPMPAFGMDLGDVPHHPHNYDTRAEQSTTRTALLNLAERLGETKPRGLLKADVEQLPSYRFKADTARSPLDQSSCVVCMYDFESKQLLRVLPCHHEFHAKCVDKWLKSNRTCPICRKDASEPASKSE